MQSINKITNEILKESARYLSKMPFKDKETFNEYATKFVNSIQSKMVRLSLKSATMDPYEKGRKFQFWNIVFGVVFILDDSYIDKNVYESGTVYVFPSQKFYDDVHKVSRNMFKVYPEWDDARTTGTIIGRARVYA